MEAAGHKTVMVHLHRETGPESIRATERQEALGPSLPQLAADVCLLASEL